uniref:Uncharacterized protein n=1 Tax=Rhizophora mucronata TaxID=61149 RepID=A0A2P2Q4T4_RHIMU
MKHKRIIRRRNEKIKEIYGLNSPSQRK